MTADRPLCNVAYLAGVSLAPFDLSLLMHEMPQWPQQALKMSWQQERFPC